MFREFGMAIKLCFGLLSTANAGPLIQHEDFPEGTRVIRRNGVTEIIYPEKKGLHLARTIITRKGFVSSDEEDKTQSSTPEEKREDFPLVWDTNFSPTVESPESSEDEDTKRLKLYKSLSLGKKYSKKRKKIEYMHTKYIEEKKAGKK